jgi:S1-C subfamily serine protease
LVDLNGRVIGIPTLAATDPQLGDSAAPGIGFAIASNTVKRIADQLIASGSVTDSGRAGLGIQATTVLGADGQPVGVLVRAVSQPAQDASIMPGDVITAVNGTPTMTIDDLQEVVAGLSPGHRARIEVVHPNGSKQTYSVTLGTL